MVKSIYLQDGEEIFVDDEDYERVSQYTWRKVFSHNSRNIVTIKNQKIISLVPFIQKESYQLIKNNDFTKRNITNKGNSQRWMKPGCKGTSKYKGVHWNKQHKKWKATIKLENKSIFLGYFQYEDDAAQAYNQAVLDFWDGGGYMNVIGEDNRGKQRLYKTKRNQPNRRKGYSNYRGVTINKKTNRILSQLQYKKKKCYIGDFGHTNQAALAYNKCAIYLHGNDAILNDVPMTDELKEFIDNWEIPEKIKQLKE